MTIADTALLVIDAQESFRQRPYWSDAGVSFFAERLQTLIDGAKLRGILVVQIFHRRGVRSFFYGLRLRCSLRGTVTYAGRSILQTQSQCADWQWPGRLARAARNSACDRVGYSHRTMLRNDDTERLGFGLPGRLRDRCHPDVSDDRSLRKNVEHRRNQGLHRTGSRSALRSYCECRRGSCRRRATSCSLRSAMAADDRS